MLEPRDADTPLPTARPTIGTWGQTWLTFRDHKVKLDSMYDLALEVFRRLEGPIPVDGLESSLMSLREPVRALRSAYKVDRVIVDYDSQSQLAYLLAYVPAYIRMAEEVIKHSLAPEDVGEKLRIGLIGAGPAPEAVAAANLLFATRTSCTRLELHVFDVAPEWSEVRRCLLQVGCYDRWDHPIEVHDHELDLRTRDVISDRRSLLARLDLILVQNCLNEDVAGDPEVMRNLHALVAVISEHGVLAIADQHGYPVVRQHLKALADQIEGSVEILSRFEDQLEMAVADRVPQALQVGLLTGEDGLKPRKKVNYGVLAVRAPGPPLSIQQSVWNRASRIVTRLRGA